MKRTHAAFLVALPILTVLTLAGCAQLESPVAPQEKALASTASASANLVSRPWEGRCEGSGVFGITLDITVDCNFSHLGLTTGAVVETLTPVPGGFQNNAVSTYTAANGDVLYTTSTGLATFMPDFSGVTFSFIETVAGGTGRFANARGSATRIGSARFSDGLGIYEIQGTLTYAASDR